MWSSYSYFQEDGGCSYITFFEITNETIERLNDDCPPPWLRLFKKFCAGPAGKPGCPKDPNRSLALRQSKTLTKDRDTGILKAAAVGSSDGESSIPAFLQQFNGKSFVITDSGYVVKDPAGEWMEMGFDVRQFPFLFKDAMYNFRNFLTVGTFHIGFMIQASEEEYLPEGLICDLYLAGLDMVAHPWMITDGIKGH